MNFRVLGRVVRVTSITVLMALLACYVLVPIVWILLSSTKNNTQLFSLGAFSVPGHIALASNLDHVFGLEGHVFLYWLLNSVGYAVIISVGSTYLSALAGYSITKLHFATRRVFAALVVGSLMVPSAVLVIPLFILEQHIHLTDTYEGVILPSLLSAFAIFFMMVYTNESMPDSVIDAAKVDGAGHLRIFHQVALPILKPGVVTIVLISFIAAWNNYFLPLVLLSNRKLFPMTLGLDNWLSTVTSSSAASSQTVVYPDIVLGTAFSILPLLVIFPILQRYVARGITLGAVAGE
jgi:multiple sugar transport system permease protein